MQTVLTVVVFVVSRHVLRLKGRGLMATLYKCREAKEVLGSAGWSHEGIPIISLIPPPPADDARFPFLLLSGLQALCKTEMRLWCMRSECQLDARIMEAFRKSDMLLANLMKFSLCGFHFISGKLLRKECM